MNQRTVVKWETCRQLECIGIVVKGTDMCLIHGSEEKTADAFRLIEKTGNIDARGLTITPDFLRYILAITPRGADGKLQVKNCNFNRATFIDADFSYTTFTQSARFDDATFEGNTSFNSAIFSCDANFDEATFHDNTWFIETIFNCDVRFYSVTFTKKAQFQNASFGGHASFSGMTSGASCIFEHVIFTKWTEFNDSIFTGDVAFIASKFMGPADFSYATFSGETDFSHATFKHNANFDGAVFEQSLQFGPLLAYRGMNLNNIQFAKLATIEISTTGLCCRGAQFPNGVHFRLRWARVVLDDADFPAPSSLTGVPSIDNIAEWHVKEQPIARVWQRLLAAEISERPQLLSLRRANVAGLGLSNVSLADCYFAGAHHLDKLRMESDVTFAIAPPIMGSNRHEWGGREVIAEERDWRADLSRTHWPKTKVWPLHRRWLRPRWPHWLNREQPKATEAGQIAGIYRALRKGREDAKDEPGAADFYYGEMEMRRHAGRFTGAHADRRTSNMSNGPVEHSVLTAYWLISGYGLRAWRAIFCLITITALFAWAFHAVGFNRAHSPQPDTYWTSALYAFRATLSLTDNQITLTAWGQLLQAILRLTGPVLLGLAILALRGRLKR